MKLNPHKGIVKVQVAFRKTIGNLSNHDGNAKENVTLKNDFQIFQFFFAIVSTLSICLM